MRFLRTALCLSLLAALAAGADAFASNNAEGKSVFERSGAPAAAARADYLLLAQGGADRNACLSACQSKNNSCLAPIAADCNSRGCTNERNVCTMQYEECTKSCPAR